MTIVITLLFMFITMEKMGMKDTLVVHRIYEVEIEQQEDDYGSKSIFRLSKMILIGIKIFFSL